MASPIDNSTIPQSGQSYRNRFFEDSPGPLRSNFESDSDNSDDSNSRLHDVLARLLAFLLLFTGLEQGYIAKFGHFSRKEAPEKRDLSVRQNSKKTAVFGHHGPVFWLIVVSHGLH